MIERDTPERGPQSNADPRRSVNWTEFAPKDLPRPADGQQPEVTSSVSVVRNNAPVWAIATPPMLLRIVNPEAVINYFEFFFLSYPKM
jgi:hypothetical protein